MTKDEAKAAFASAVNEAMMAWPRRSGPSRRILSCDVWFNEGISRSAHIQHFTSAAKQLALHSVGPRDVRVSEYPALGGGVMLRCDILPVGLNG